MNWLYGTVKFLIGFSMAIAILFFAGVSTARYFIARLTAPPPKPIFANDSPQAQPSLAPTAVANSAASPTPAAANAAPPPAAPAAPTPTPEAIPEGAYQARVTQPIGLILRTGPTTASEQIGGVAFNEEVIVLETSSDQEWIRVQLGVGGIEGWVKSGNTEQIQ
jgi:hypothetical protein